ncbi:MAG: ATP-binding protein [Pseudomonadota bacterium]
MTIDVHIPDRTRPSIVLVLALTLVVAIGATYLGAQRLLHAQAISVATSQHALYVRSLNEALKQHQHLPFVIGQNPLIVEKVARGAIEPLNALLASFAEASGLEAIYVMGLDGDVVAASNHALPTSFLGQNYGFRPYFQHAASGERSDYFAIGATTGRPGYFVAEPLRSVTGDIVGVIAIKLDISELQASWQSRGEEVLATNADGIVVMASNPDWLYQTVTDLNSAQRASIAESRQFGAEDIPRLDWVDGVGGRILLQGQSYFLTSGPTEVVDWTVHLLTNQATVRQQTLLATAVLGAIVTGLIAFSVFLRSRRIQVALDVSQRQRQALEDTNSRLVAAQKELARSSKLAALGQLAASVTHELGQPISALKNHLFAAEIGGEITSSATLANLRRLAERMEGITKQLRFFAREHGEERKDTDMATVVGEAVALLRHDLSASDVSLSWTPPQTACVVRGNQLQLEQVMINILRNARDAVQETHPARIAIDCSLAEGLVTVTVADNGDGLSGESLETLQEPFYSTRSSGQGMGLGLAISAEIIDAHGGAIAARDLPEGGAVFTISLPAKEGMS